MPINISQESYERVKRGATTGIVASKPKKPKVESPEPIKTEEAPDAVPIENHTASHCILLSYIPGKEKKELEKIVMYVTFCNR